LAQLAAVPGAGVAADLLQQRYGIGLGRLSQGGPDGETWLIDAAARHTSGDTTRMATKLLDDYRCARLGSIALELPGSLQDPADLDASAPRPL
jgi:ribosome biogenesis GTPase A